MNNKLKRELLRASVLTFEQVAFMLVNQDIEENGEEKPAKADAAVEVDFNGPFGGNLQITVMGGVLPELAANMLGEEEPPVKQRQLDALGEVANIICGNMLPGIAGSTEVFHVDAPRIIDAGEARKETDTGFSAFVSLGIESGRAEVFLRIDENAASFLKEAEK